MSVLDDRDRDAENAALRQVITRLKDEHDAAFSDGLEWGRDAERKKAAFWTKRKIGRAVSGIMMGSTLGLSLGAGLGFLIWGAEGAALLATMGNYIVAAIGLRCAIRRKAP